MASSMSNGESSSGSDALKEQTKKFKRLRPHLYLLQPAEDPEFVLVFFHGLLLEESEQEHAFWSTWKKRENYDCWPITLLPEYLEAQKPKDWEPYRIRVLAVSYESRTSVHRSKIKDTDDYTISENLMDDLVRTGFCRGKDRTDVPIILIGHDLGGILIKLFIMKVAKEAARKKSMEEERFLQQLKAIIFYATPHSGSRAIERVAAEIPDTTQNQMLKLMRVLGPDLARVNGEFSTYRKGTSQGLPQPRFETYALVPTHLTEQKGFNEEMVVEEGSARYDVDQVYSVGADHFNVCQPQGVWESSVQQLGNKIREIKEERVYLETLKQLKAPTHPVAPGQRSAERGQYS